MQPILVYMSKVDGKFLFSPVSVNFLTEIVKVFFAICMLLWQVCVPWSVLSCNFILLFPSSGAALGFTLGTDIRGFGLCHFLEFVECSDGACFYPSKSLKSKSLLLT
jgi:hypothetical protein